MFSILFCLILPTYPKIMNFLNVFKFNRIVFLFFQVWITYIYLGTHHGEQYGLTSQNQFILDYIKRIKYFEIMRLSRIFFYIYDYVQTKECYLFFTFEKSNDWVSLRFFSVESTCRTIIIAITINRTRKKDWWFKCC